VMEMFNLFKSFDHPATSEMFKLFKTFYRLRYANSFESEEPGSGFLDLNDLNNSNNSNASNNSNILNERRD